MGPSYRVLSDFQLSLNYKITRNTYEVASPDLAGADHPARIIYKYNLKSTFISYFMFRQVVYLCIMRLWVELNGNELFKKDNFS